MIWSKLKMSQTLNQLKSDSYSFFISEGWKIEKNKSINHFDIKFDILKKGNQSKALYVTEQYSLFADFISIGKAMQAFPKNYKIILCIPKSSRINPDILLSLEDVGIEVITIENGRVITIASGSNRSKIEKQRVKNIKKKISDINLISAANLGFKIFGLDQETLSKIKPRIKSETEYLDQILNINCILDDINVKEIKIKFNPSKSEIDKGPISLLEFSLKASGKKIDKTIFDSFKMMRRMRADRPVHKKDEKKKKELEKIFKNFTGTENPNKIRLWESIIQRFYSCLNLLKETIKR